MSIEKLTKLSQRIQYLRVKADLTQSAFGEKVGVSGAYISELESGKKNNLSDILSELICLKFHVNKPWLLKNEGPVYAHEIVAEIPEGYGDDEVTRLILDMVRNMDVEEKRDVLKYAEEKKQASAWREMKKKKEA